MIIASLGDIVQEVNESKVMTMSDKGCLFVTPPFGNFNFV